MDKIIDTDDTRTGSKKMRRGAESSSSATDVMGGLDSHCVIPGNGQLSQPVISKQGDVSDPDPPGQSGSEKDGNMDNRLNDKRPKRGLPLSQKVWLCNAVRSHWGQGTSLSYSEIRIILARGINDRELPVDIDFERARHVIRHALRPKH